MKRIVKIILIILFIVLAFNFINSTKDMSLKTPNGRYSVLLANTDELRTRGLSGKESLGKKEVMLFTFERPGIYGIWMKDMLMNIDIVFLDENMEVINYYDDVSPSTYPSIFYPEQNSMYVIEMASGERIKAGLEKGVKVYYK